MDEITRVYIRAVLVSICILAIIYGVAYQCFAVEHERDSGSGWSETGQPGDSERWDVEGSGEEDGQGKRVLDSGVPGDVPDPASDIHAIRQYWEFTLFGIIPVTVSIVAVIAGFVWFRKVFIRM